MPRKVAARKPPPRARKPAVKRRPPRRKQKGTGLKDDALEFLSRNKKLIIGGLTIAALVGASAAGVKGANNARMNRTQTTLDQLVPGFSRMSAPKLTAFGKALKDVTN